MRFCKDCSNYVHEHDNVYTGQFEHETCTIPIVTSGPDPVTGEPMRHLRPQDPREKNSDFNCSDFVQLVSAEDTLMSPTLREKIKSAMTRPVGR